MHELWLGPKFGRRDNKKDLPTLRPKNKNGGPSEDPSDEGLVMYQHWLSPELLTSDLQAHKDWVAQCLPRPTSTMPNPASGTDVSRVISSNSAWSAPWIASARLSRPLEPEWQAETMKAYVGKWRDADALARRQLRVGSEQ
jgi:hypothetical protein